jgi:hypothetical protein
MLDKCSNVFIIGAGAGKPYGLHTGKELYEYLRKSVLHEPDLRFDLLDTMRLET